MPSLMKTPCNHPGCRRATRGRYCEDHRHLAYRRPSERRRGTPAERGYDHHWRKLQQAYIAEHPLCEDCLDDDTINAWNLEVDHILPIEVRPDLRLCWDNLRTRCRQHHSLKTLEDQRKYGTAQHQ